MVTKENITSNSDNPISKFIIDELSEYKAQNIIILDVRNKTTITDWMIIASGRSSKNVSMIADKISLTLKIKYGINSRIEGINSGKWAIVDIGSVILHIFHHEMRDIYKLEELWS